MGYDLDRIRQQVSVPSLLSYYGIQDEKLLCLWHTEDGESLHVYEDHLYCFGCKKRKDIFDFVMAKEKCGLDHAVEWVLAKAKILPTQAPRIVKSDYKGPVPRAWIDYWHRQMGTEQRSLLHQRLITDATIDRHLIGWRPDYHAFVLPYWRGYPGESEVDIIQYRATANSPQFHGKPWRYIGEKGYNRPCVSNTHMINPLLAIFVIGTFDGLHGEQDGMAIHSLNGTDALLDPHREETKYIRQLFAHVQYKYVVPDATLVEFLPATRIAENLGAEVRFFPANRDWQGKDYNDMRRAGKSPFYFIQEILEMNLGKYVFAIKEEHVEYIADIVEMITRGDGETAFKILQLMEREQPYHFGLVSHALQLMAHRRPDKYAEVFTNDEWLDLGMEFSQTISFAELAGVIKRFSELAASRLGGF